MEVFKCVNWLPKILLWAPSSFGKLFLGNLVGARESYGKNIFMGSAWGAWISLQELLKYLLFSNSVSKQWSTSATSYTGSQVMGKKKNLGWFDPRWSAFEPVGRTCKYQSLASGQQYENPLGHLQLDGWCKKSLGQLESGGGPSMAGGRSLVIVGFVPRKISIKGYF